MIFFRKHGKDFDIEPWDIEEERVKLTLGDGKISFKTKFKDESVEEALNKMFGKNERGKYKTIKIKDVKTKDENIVSSSWISKNLSNVKKNVKNVFGEDAWKKLNNKLLKLDEKQLSLISKCNKNLKNIVNDRGLNYYLPSKGVMSIDLVRDMENIGITKHFSMFFHEYGHLLDNVIGKGEMISRNDSFGKKFYNSLANEYKKITDKDGKLDNFVRFKLNSNSSITSGIQDIISGLSNGRENLKNGHSSSYWNKDGESERWKNVSSEAFANMHSAYMDKEIGEAFEKYFPETYKMFKEEVIKFANK